MKPLAGMLGMIEEELARGELVPVHLFVTPHLLNKFIGAERVNEAEGT